MENEKSENEIHNQSKVSSLAITSLVCAIISPFTTLFTLVVISCDFIPILIIGLLSPIILSLLAVYFGIISFKKIKASHDEVKGKNLAIAGIVLGFLIFVFLITKIYLPALGKVNDIGWRITCENRMTEIGKAMMTYVNDFDQYPTPEKWCDLLIEECNVPADKFRCPLAEEGPCNYALNKYIADLGTTFDPDIVVFFETLPGWNQVGGPEILTTENHQGDGCNVVFLDSHVEFIYSRKINKLKWKPD